MSYFLKLQWLQKRSCGILGFIIRPSSVEEMPEPELAAAGDSDGRAAKRGVELRVN